MSSSRSKKLSSSPTRSSSSPTATRRRKKTSSSPVISSPRKKRTMLQHSPKRTTTKSSSSSPSVASHYKHLRLSAPVPSSPHQKRYQRFHLVIDLDGTFVDTRLDIQSYNTFLKVINSPEVSESARSELISRVYLFKLGDTTAWTILRPNTRVFLDFATRYFRRVSVWTAGRKDYGEIISEILFEAPLQKPGIIFSWNECVKGDTDVSHLHTHEEKVKVFAMKTASPSNKEVTCFSKPLMLIAKQDEIVENSPSSVKGSAAVAGNRRRRAAAATIADDDFRFSKDDPLHDILMLDDRHDIAVHNPQNLVKIPLFEHRLTRTSLFSPDVALEKFTQWLMREEVMSARDIRDVCKKNIFTGSGSSI
jgi:hypothetical protein